MSVKVQLQQVKESLAKLDPNNRDNLVEIARLKTQEIELTKQVADEEAVEAQQGREQQKQESIDSTVDALAQMFEALFPEATYKLLIGITDFEEKRQNFYQLTNMLITEKLEASYAVQEQILAQRDDSIQTLTSQAAEYKAQYEEEKRVRETTQEAFNKLSDDYTALEARAATDKAGYEATISNLNAKIDAAQKAKNETKPSQSFAEKINSIKSKNELSPDEMLARWNARQTSDSVKIEVPSIQQESSFRSESSGDHSTDTSNHQVLASETLTGEQFHQKVQPPAIPAVEAGGSQGQQSNESVAQETGTVTKAELEARLAKFANEYGLMKSEVA